MAIKKKYGAVALYSGGLDSTVAPILSQASIDREILLLMIDLGMQEGSIKRASERAKILDMDFHIIDGKKEFSEIFLSEAVKMNGSYWGYPLITPLSRAYMVSKAFKFLDEDLNGVKFLIHGCTLNQNTRYRIEKHCRLRPDVIPLGPFTENHLTREEKIQILEKRGIKTGPGSEIGEDETIFGRAIEGQPLNYLDDVEKKDFFLRIKDIEECPDSPSFISLLFKDGRPINCDGKNIGLDKIVARCLEIGNNNGVGRIGVFEDTIPELGYKQFGIFESSPSEILYCAHRFIEAAVFNKLEREIKRQLDHQWAEIIYRGGWFDRDRKEISAFCDHFEKKVNGKVVLKVYKGNVSVKQAQIPGCRLADISY